MPRPRGDNRHVGTGISERNFSDRGRGRHYSGGDRSFFKDAYYGGSSDGWGHRRRGGRNAGHRGYRDGGRGFRGNNQSTRGYKRNQGNEEVDGKRAKMEIGTRLKETDIGVTEFIGDHAGFSGVVKERFGDFHVHEINMNGEIAKLTDQSIPPESEQLEDMEELKKGFPPEIWEQLETLMEADNVVSSVNIDVTTMTKDQRRTIHSIAKKIPNTVSQTVENGENKVIVVAKTNKQKQSGFKLRRDQRVDWSRRGGNYCHFVLHKVNMDTMDALNQMAIYLRMKSNMLNYAGTKDRRARTTQWVSLKKVNPCDILAAAKAVRGAYVGNFKFCTEPLKLGMLSGNRFSIALRDVTGSDEEIEKAMTSLRDNGFINYYGLQRFGTVAAIPTHEIGRALLQGKWHEAIELILKPRAGEQQRNLVEAREIYQKTKDAHAAFQRISRQDKIESKLLWGLHVCGEKNPQGALDWIPRNTNLMYIHAYQSLIWNIIVSKRIKELGCKPVVGDLVYENPNFKEETESLEYIHNDNEEENDNNEKKDQDDQGEIKEAVEGKAIDQDKSIEIEKKKEEGEAEIQNTDRAGHIKMEIKIDDFKPSAVDDDKNNKDSETKDKENVDQVKDIKKEEISVESDKEYLHTLPGVKTLTEEDLPNYTLADIVMPQPGWRVTYPTYAKPWFDEILARDGLTTDLRQKNRKYSLGGAYRKMFEVPSDISWRVMRYRERHDELLLCDLHEMRGSPVPKDDPEGKYKALIVEMSLKPSTYATMTLREILKCDTSPEIQAAQSAANKALEEEEEEEKKGEQKYPKTEETENNDDNIKDSETKMEVVVETEMKMETTPAFQIEEEKSNATEEAEALLVNMECNEITEKH